MMSKQFGRVRLEVSLGRLLSETMVQFWCHAMVLKCRLLFTKIPVEIYVYYGHVLNVHSCPN